MMEKGFQLEKLQEANSDSGIVIALTPFQGGSVACLPELGKSCEPQNQGLRPALPNLRLFKASREAFLRGRS